MDFSGGLWLLCWIVVVVVDVGPCTCISGAIIKLACTGDQ